MSSTITPDRLRSRLARSGTTLREHCNSLGFTEEDYRTAVAVMNGFCKARYGRAHRVAVALGLKAAA